MKRVRDNETAMLSDHKCLDIFSKGIAANLHFLFFGTYPKKTVSGIAHFSISGERVLTTPQMLVLAEAEQTKSRSSFWAELLLFYQAVSDYSLACTLKFFVVSGSELSTSF